MVEKVCRFVSKVLTLGWLSSTSWARVWKQKGQEPLAGLHMPWDVVQALLKLQLSTELSIPLQRGGLDHGHQVQELTPDALHSSACCQQLSRLRGSSPELWERKG